MTATRGDVDSHGGTTSNVGSGNRLRHVLIVSDEESSPQRLRFFIQSLRCDVSVARSALRGLTIAVTTEPDVIVVSMTLPPPDHAFEFARSVRAKARSPLRLVATGHGAVPKIEANLFDAWLQLPLTTTEALRTALGLT